MRSRYRRRDFIRLGGLGVALVPMAGGRSAHARGVRAEPGGPGTIPAGYWLGSEERTDPERWALAEGETALVSAAAISPEPELDGGAAVTVHGLVEGPPAWHTAALQGLALTVRYVLPDLADSDGIDFRAWSYERGPVTNDGSPIRFDVPTGPGVDLCLTLEREVGRTGPGRRVLDAALTGTGAGPLSSSPARAHLRLTSGRTPGTPKLRRGVYVLAIGDRPRWAPLAWEDHRFPPAGFDHLVVSIDRPTSAA